MPDAPLLFDSEAPPAAEVPAFVSGDIVTIKHKSQTGIIMRLERTSAYVNSDDRHGAETGWYPLESLERIR